MHEIECWLPKCIWIWSNLSSAARIYFFFLFFFVLCTRFPGDCVPFSCQASVENIGKQIYLYQKLSTLSLTHFTITAPTPHKSYNAPNKVKTKAEKHQFFSLLLFFFVARCGKRKENSNVGILLWFWHMTTNHRYRQHNHHHISLPSASHSHSILWFSLLASAESQTRLPNVCVCSCSFRFVYIFFLFFFYFSSSSSWPPLFKIINNLKL